jgi:hypothetical protein
MADLMQWLVPLTMGAVVLVLAMGLINMMRAGPAGRSQNLMRWRVILQFTAVVVIMAGLYFSTG